MFCAKTACKTMYIGPDGPTRPRGPRYRPHDVFACLCTCIVHRAWSAQKPQAAGGRRRLGAGGPAKHDLVGPWPARRNRRTARRDRYALHYIPCPQQQPMFSSISLSRLHSAFNRSASSFSARMFSRTRGPQFLADYLWVVLLPVFFLFFFLFFVFLFCFLCFSFFVFCFFFFFCFSVFSIFSFCFFFFSFFVLLPVFWPACIPPGGRRPHRPIVQPPCETKEVPTYFCAFFSAPHTGESFFSWGGSSPTPPDRSPRLRGSDEVC